MKYVEQPLRSGEFLVCNTSCRVSKQTTLQHCGFESWLQYKVLELLYMIRYSPLITTSRANLKMAVCKEYRGSKYNFIQDPSDSLTCQICYSVASSPQQHSQCGKLFCKTCVEDYRDKNEQGTCPNCRQEFFYKNLL